MCSKWHVADIAGDGAATIHSLKRQRLVPVWCRACTWVAHAVQLLTVNGVVLDEVRHRFDGGDVIQVCQLEDLRLCPYHPKSQAA